MSERVAGIFPERQVHFRTDGRVSYFRITTAGQLLAGVALVAAMGWTAFSSYSYVAHEKVVAVKDGQIASARLAYHSLLGEVAEYQNKFNAITQDLERNHGTMLGLVERNAKLQTSLRSVSNELRTTQDDRSTIVGAREALRRKLANLEQELGGLTTRNFSLKDNLDTVASDLESALSERNEARFEGSRMRTYVQQLEDRLASLQQSHETSVLRLTDQTLSQIGDLEKIVSLTGINPQKLAALDDPLTGQGGPFIPAEALDALPAGELKKSLDALDNHLARLNSLQSAVRHLPLVAPLDTYYITSGFGKRRDPLNKRWAAHYGLDFGSAKKAPIYATAPGIVKHAGWKGRYGRYIEIDHGNGVITRFGHLNKIFVKRGQKVEFRQKIGLLGNSGRTTGAHLHYETLFNKRNINPMKFIKAGRNVFQKQ
ncbi:MAG: peptidoglycan DD-metalloendopeptidase family protein [Rhodospirillaceae bacterium]|nr:peptidoglycan DD-metalloendopeptidase family protein [Rhodospirillaceae bacterium]